MTLAAQQAMFMAQVLDEAQPLPPGWSARHAAGFAIYRNNYRTALVEALRETYPRTANWVGEAPFRAAAVHHLISHPPRSWTLDDAGLGFAETLAELFAGDPEVAELATLEWAMHRAFVAADAAPLDATGFAAATADFGDEDWALFELDFLPGTMVSLVAHDIPAIWHLAAADRPGTERHPLPELHGLVVWREGLRPVFQLVDADEAVALAGLLAWDNYGTVCAALAERLGEAGAVQAAGAMLGRWLRAGLITAVRR